MPNEKRAKKAACGRGDCGVSTGIMGELTFGFGELDFNGYWDTECEPCTRREFGRSTSTKEYGTK